MFRTTRILIGFGWLCGCHGGSGDDKGGDIDIAPVLATAAGEYETQGEIVRNTCGGDLGDYVRLTIKLSQVATGVSVFFDPDVGWVPCGGSITDFDCQWGNAPADDIVSVWTWSLVGTTDGDVFDATLRLVVTCEGEGNCEPCTLVADYTGNVN